MNLAYQVSMHVSAHMTQWPDSDEAAERERITNALLTGNAWLYHEPGQIAPAHPGRQMDLFGAA